MKKNINKIALTVLLLATLFISILSAFSQDNDTGEISNNIQSVQSVATVDMLKIVDILVKDSAEGRSIESKKETEKAKLLQVKRQLEDEEQTLSDEDFKEQSAKAQNFMKKVKEYQGAVRDMEDALTTAYMKLQKNAFERVKAVVQRIAEIKGITLVLAASKDMPNAVLFSDGTLDLTEEVLAEVK